jgi:hypothetical protein
MSELTEPLTDQDLPRPFTRIGEPGWAERARAVLELYEVPLPTPVPASEIQHRERELGIRFPDAYSTLLSELGPADLDGFRFLPPREATTLRDFYLRDELSEADRVRLPEFLAVLEYCGTDDPFAVHLPTEVVYRCGHDPLGFSCRLDSLHVLAQLAFLALPRSYYGFPGEKVEELVARAQVALAGREL